MNKEIVGCPVAHDASAPPALEMVEHPSQRVLDGWRDIDWVRFQLREEIEQSYQEMAQHQPDKAALRVARKARSIFRGASLAVVQGCMVTMLNEVEGPDRDAYIAEVTYSAEAPNRPGLGAVYHGAAFEWMVAMEGLTERARRYAYSSFPNADVVSQIDVVMPLLNMQVSQARARLGMSRGINGQSYSLDHVKLLNREALVSTFDLIMAGYIAIARSGNTDVDVKDANAVADTLLKNIEPLSRVASTNRKVLQDIMPNDYGSGLPEIVYQRDGSDLQRLERAFRLVNGVLIPTHPSIRKREWRVPGNCGGLAWLRLPDETNTKNVEEFFTALGLEGQGVDKYGRTHSVRNLLAVGIEVGRRTLLKDRNSPVLTKYAA